MSNELSKAIKKKTDAQFRTMGEDRAPSISEGAGGDVIIVDPRQYAIPYVAGKNIHIGTSGNSKVINALMNVLAGQNITVGEPDPDTGAVTISSSIGGKAIDLSGLADGYVLKYDLASDSFVLGEGGGISEVPQATETTLGGIKAAERTTENVEVKIDPTTGKLYSNAPDEAVNGLPAGGTSGQVLAKIDATDFNAEWVDAPAGDGLGEPQWSNGSGERRFLILATVTGGNGGSPDQVLSAGLVNSLYLSTGTAQKVLTYKFPRLNRLTGIAFTQNTTVSNGVWTIDGSLDGVTWVNLVTDYVLGGSPYGPIFTPTAPVYVREFTNAAQYLYYRLTLNTGSSTSNSPYIQQVLFKCEPIF